jgi:hypothetical protein
LAEFFNDIGQKQPFRPPLQSSTGSASASQGND